LHVLMNQDSDKEMDLLLRRVSRRGASSVAGGANPMPGAAHMDADELSAYAEGALPEGARSRYASHLADCDSCRKIVTELVLSSNIEAEAQGTVTQTIDAPARSWREWMATLFSPPVLRYAAPALALIAFASIIFVVVMRNREVTSFVADKRPGNTQASSPAVQPQNDETATSNAGTNDGVSDNHGVASNANAASVAQNSNTTITQTKEAAPAGTSTQPNGFRTGDAPKPPDLPADASPPPPAQQQGAAEAQRQAEALPVVTPGNKPIDKVTESKDDASLADRGRRDNRDAAAGGGGPRKRSGESADTTGALGAATTSPSAEERKQKNEAAKSAPAPAARARREAEGADDDEYAASTRTVAGKRFRQQNGTWVDTAYSSSRSTVKVKRGSEQYRALVADEPLIGTVANSLGGDVIVVVRGRAYHIY
jgi:hypothetical protein